jgi:hypothetical protein
MQVVSAVAEAAASQESAGSAAGRASDLERRRNVFDILTYCMLTVQTGSDVIDCVATT